MKNKFNTSHLLLCAALACGFAPAIAVSQTSAPKASGASIPAPTAPTATAQASQSLELADKAPTRYEVRKGDTLWGIAARFLKNPWRWNEIWRMNRDQIRNPHWIYPGDVLVLSTGADGRPQLSLAPVEERPTVKLSPEIRTAPINTGAIPAIPPAIIDPFLTRPLVVDAGALERSPRIVGGPDSRVVLAAGYTIYATGLNEADGRNWQVYRPGKALISPARKDVLGYEAVYLGDVVVDKFGDVSTLVVLSSNQEIVAGDRLVQAPRERIVSYPPHPPERAINGRIIALPTTLVESGRDAVITVDLGSTDGMEIGHVVALYHDPGRIPAPGQPPSAAWKFWEDKPTLQLPPERIGLAFVFRVFDRVSYALVLNSTKQVELGDWVQKP
jgi:LysM repeat protein